MRATKHSADINQPTAKRHDVTEEIAHKGSSTALPAEYPLEAGDAAVVLEGLRNGLRTRVANAVGANAGVESKIGRHVSRPANDARDKTHHRSNIGPRQNGTTSQGKSPTKKAAQRFQRNTHYRLVMLLLCARASAMALAPTSPMLLPRTLEVGSMSGKK